jgi:hypothetical protein
MSQRLINRLSGAVVAAALVITTQAVLAATPAGAAEVCTTVATLTLSPYTSGMPVYKDSIDAEAALTATCSLSPMSTVLAGEMVLERRLPAGSWAAVSTQTASSYQIFYPMNYVGNAEYRARYTGGTYPGIEQTWDPSVSSTVRVTVARKVAFRDLSTESGSRGRFKISAVSDLAGRTITFQVKQRGEWRLYKKTSVPATGVVTTTFRNSIRGIRYRLILPSTVRFAGKTYGPYVATRY